MVHTVGLLLQDGVSVFDIGVPPQLFGAATDAEGRRLYEVLVCSVDGGPVRTSAGFTACPEHDLAALAGADTVVVAGVKGPAAYLGPPPPSRLLEVLRDAAAHRRLMSICTGAFTLAAAGVLDGRPATTHWSYAEEFMARYPRVRLDPDVLFVDDGAVLTSAGVGAGVDLCLHVVRRDHGSEVANRVARRCVVPPWRAGGQSQFIERPLPSVADTSTEPTRAWAARHLGRPLRLTELAEHSRMSVRTFTRRFREETGMSPARWLAQQRLDLARRLLESTDLPVDAVAGRAGFGTATSLRQHLHAAIGVAPGEYRRTFGTVRGKAGRGQPDRLRAAVR
jgi:transcriptional regulator GlxA family with amidase domain